MTLETFLALPIVFTSDGWGTMVVCFVYEKATGGGNGLLLVAGSVIVVVSPLG
jgi:hypothetical protein